MRTKKTHHDGWDCVPELKGAASCIGNLRHVLYEIENCVRESSLPDLVSEFNDAISEAKEYLDSINTNVEYETIYEDEDDK